MKFEEYLAEQAQDAEYRRAERELKPYLDLANKVLALRLERGWSQEELARRVGTKQANISRIENGQANPTLKLLHKLADAFEAELTVDLGARSEDAQTSPQFETKVSVVIFPETLTSYIPWKVGPPTWQPSPPTPARSWLAKVEVPTTVEPDDSECFTAA